MVLMFLWYLMMQILYFIRFILGLIFIPARNYFKIKNFKIKKIKLKYCIILFIIYLIFLFINNLWQPNKGKNQK